MVYFAADNNLARFTTECMNNIVAGAAGNNLNGGNLLVYLDKGNGTPQLIQIKKGADGTIDQVVVKEYAEQNSVSKAVMQSVLDEVFRSGDYKADKYGLFLWSHGTAWLPSDIDNYLRSFGQDGNNFMEIDALKETLSRYKFDFLVFDACYMASVEVAYALKDVADYIVASPTEILAESMPYDTMLKMLFSNEALETSLRQASEEFCNHYAGSSASVSLVKTSALPALATACKSIFSGKFDNTFDINLAHVQWFEYLKPNAHFLYDFDDYVKQIASESQYATFQQCLADAVLYKETTDQAYYAYPNWWYDVDKDRYSGLTVYAPQESLTLMNGWYKDMDWYKAVY